MVLILSRIFKQKQAPHPYQPSLFQIFSLLVNRIFSGLMYSLHHLVPFILLFQCMTKLWSLYMQNCIPNLISFHQFQHYTLVPSIINLYLEDLRQPSNWFPHFLFFHSIVNSPNNLQKNLSKHCIVPPMKIFGGFSLFISSEWNSNDSP